MEQPQERVEMVPRAVLEAVGAVLAKEWVSRASLVLATLLTAALTYGAGSTGQWQAWACLTTWSVVVYLPLLWRLTRSK